MDDTEFQPKSINFTKYNKLQAYKPAGYFLNISPINIESKFLKLC